MAARLRGIVLTTLVLTATGLVLSFEDAADPAPAMAKAADAFLAALAAELKRACGTGGTVADAAVEIQGDQRERLRPLLAAKGWIVRG